jgi:hypothetical protein
MAKRLNLDAIAATIERIPESWLAEDPGFESKARQRDAYLNFFKARLGASKIFAEEAIRARAALV